MEFSLIYLFFVLLVAWVGGALTARVGYPAIVGEILAGIVFGPPLLGWIRSDEGLVTLAEIGVFLMMLYVGMEIELESFRKVPLSALLVAGGAFITPFVLTFIAAVHFGLGRPASLIMGTVTGVTSLAIMSRIFIDLKLFNTRLALVLMTGALIGDTLGLLFFTGLNSITQLGAFRIGEALVVLGKATTFFIVTFFLGLRVFPTVGKSLMQAGFNERTANFTLVLMVALVFASMAELAGFHSILGAFFAGMFLHEGVLKRKLSHEITRLVHDFSLGFLTPIFFVLSGFQLKLSIFQSHWKLLSVIIAAAFLGKIMGSLLFSILGGLGWREGLVLGVGLNARGGVDIIIAALALELGLLSTELFSILVVTGMATTLLVPSLLKLGVYWLRKNDQLIELKGKRTRILIIGASRLAQSLARMFRSHGQVTLVDTNRYHVHDALAEGFHAVVGSALDEDTLRELGASETQIFLALTPNAEVNVLAGQLARSIYAIPEVYAALTSEEHEALDPFLRDYDIRTLGGRFFSVEDWDHFIHTQEAREESIPIEETLTFRDWLDREALRENLLPLLLVRKNKPIPVFEDLVMEPGDALWVLVYKEGPALARDRFDRLVERCPILDLPQGTTMESFFQQVAEIMAPPLGLDSSALFAHIMNREQQSSTVLTPELAIPHILIEGNHPQGILIARSREGIAFNPEANRVHIIFVLIGTPSERNFHLRALSAIAQIVQNQDFVQSWLGASDEKALRKLILNAERRRFPDLIVNRES